MIYCKYSSLWISYDSANTWSFIEDIGTDKRYASGCTEGEIYNYCKNPTSFLYRSTNYGPSFEEINSGVFGFPEVGTNVGELYIFTGSTWPVFKVDLLLSTNYGASFDTIFIDSITAGNYLSGHFPIISRGSQTGDIYLVSWHLPSNYHIFHSYDYGQNFELKYVSEECIFDLEQYYFTAGKQSGEFYVVKHIPWVDGINTELYIYYSNDTASTFTEYYHFLDEYFPVNTYENKYFTNAPAIRNYPNPFADKTTICFELPEDYENPVLSIYTANGKIVRQFSVVSKKSQPWDARDEKGNLLPDGIYFYNLEINGRITDSKKMVKLQ